MTCGAGRERWRPPGGPVEGGCSGPSISTVCPAHDGSRPGRRRGARAVAGGRAPGLLTGLRVGGGAVIRSVHRARRCLKRHSAAAALVDALKQQRRRRRRHDVWLPQPGSLLALRGGSALTCARMPVSDGCWTPPSRAFLSRPQLAQTPPPVPAPPRCLGPPPSIPPVTTASHVT